MTQERQQKDLHILDEVTNEWVSSAGGDISVMTILSYLQRIHQRFGEDFTIEGAGHALDRLSEDAQVIKTDLLNKKTSSLSDPTKEG